MKLHIDKEADALYLRLDDSEIIESEEVSPGVVLDFNAHNQVVGIEMLGLSALRSSTSRNCDTRPPEPGRRNRFPPRSKAEERSATFPGRSIHVKEAARPAPPG